MKFVIKYDVFEVDSMNLKIHCGIVGSSVDSIVNDFKIKLLQFVDEIESKEVDKL